MKSVVIYKSVHHGNTKKIAKALTQVLDSELEEPENFEPSEINKNDLVGFGSGIYFGKHHKKIFKLLEKLPKNDGLDSFIFSTSGLPKFSFFNDFESPIRDELKKKGFNVVGSFSCRGYENYGPFKYIGGIHTGRPNKNDLENAKEFARGLKEDESK